MTGHGATPSAWPLSHWRRLFWAAIVLLAAVLFAFTAVRQVEKNPLRMDEVDLYNSIATWATLGAPLAYLGQPLPPDDWMLPLGERTLDDGQLYRFYRFKPETGIQKELFFALRDGVLGRYAYLPHPQLYLFGHWLLFRLAPLTSDTSHLLRYFNLLWVAGLVAGMALLSQSLYRSRPLAFPLALLLLAVNGFFLRAALLIDFQAPTACLAVWYAWAFVRSQESRAFSLPLALATLLFWFSNFGTTISVLLGTGLYVLLLGWRVKPWRALLSVAAGTVAFLPAYWLFSRVFDLPFSQPFIYAASRIGGGAGGLAEIVAAVWSYSLWYSQEIGPWLVGAALALLVASLVNRRAIDRPALALPPALAFAGILAQAALRADAFHFPKYVFFTVPLLSIFVAGELATLLSGAASGRPAGRWAAGAAALFLVALLGLSAAQSWRSIQAPGGTLYDPGEVGLVEAAQAAQAEAPLDTILLARKDAGFLAQRQFIEWEGPLLTDPDLLEQTIELYGIRYAIAGPLLLGPEAQATWPYLATAFEVVIDAGDYVLLRKR